MRFYVSGIEKTIYRKAIDAEDADEAIAKFKEMIDQSTIEDDGTYLDEVMCRTQGQDFAEIYDGAEDEQEDDDDEEGEEEYEEGEYEYDEGEDEAELEQTTSEHKTIKPSQNFEQTNNPSQPSSFNQNQY